MKTAITPKERLNAQKWGIGICLVLLLAENIAWGFDVYSVVALTVGSIALLLLLFFKKDNKMKAAKFKKGDLVLWNELLGRVEDIYYDEAKDTYFYTLGKYKWVEERDITLADWRDKTKILRRK